MRLAVLIAVGLGGSSMTALAAVVPEHVAQSVGLTRAWHTQAAIDPATQTVVNAVVADDTILLLTSAGKMQALDTATGATRWADRYGDPTQTVLGPGVGPSLDGPRVAAVVGSTFYVSDVTTGRRLLERKLGGAPGGAPALTADRLFVPLLRGKLAAYPLSSPVAVPFRVASPGLLLDQPVVVADRVVWANVRGEVHAASVLQGQPIYRMKLSAGLAGKPSVSGDNLYLTTKDGYVHAIEGQRGRPVWRRPIGVSIALPPVALGDRVYVGDVAGRLHAFDAANGELQWTFQGSDLFVSASPTRVYTLGPAGNLAVLDRATGRHVGDWPATGQLLPIENSIDDRLYFLSPSGLVQAFHEVDLDQPARHDGAVLVAPGDDVDPAEAAPTAEPIAVEPPADDPFAPESPAEDEPDVSDDPFADPFGDEPDAETDDDDPFADF